MRLANAVRDREELRFDYASKEHAPDETATRRRAQPHHLVTWDGRWYLVAWDVDRDDWRLFRVDRMSPRTPNGPRFAPRELPDVQAFVRRRFRGGDAPGWPCEGAAVLHSPASAVAPFVEDGLVEDLGPDRCRVDARFIEVTENLAHEVSAPIADEIQGMTHIARALGIAAERDLLLAAARYLQASVEVSEVMHRGVVTATPDMPVAEAADLMVSNRIGGLPVVDKGRLLGIITEADVEVSEVWKGAPADVVQVETLGGEALKRAPAGYSADHPLIGDIKRKNFAILSPPTPQAATASGFLDECEARAARARPFMAFLSGALGVDY